MLLISYNHINIFIQYICIISIIIYILIYIFNKKMSLTWDGVKCRVA